ncbi:MAG: BamA/TamA family outer membrane protein [Plesiomonas sp.]|uniref:BamA/TamA family outer membrane protein n=1 Tax=Plesiomonas sp. TaxID=2486279 RepID=UPI003F3B89ED
MLRIQFISILMAGVCSSFPVAAQTWIDDLLTDLGASDSWDERKRIDWGVLPGPFYNPELGVGMGVAAIGLYRADALDRQTQPSTLSLTGFVSSTGAFGIGFENNTLFSQDQWRFFLKGNMKSTPTGYWGVGDEMGSRPENKLHYTADEMALTPQLFYRVAQSTYLGVGSSLFYSSVKDKADNRYPASSPLAFGSSVMNAGISSHFLYDSRDFIPNPYRGQVFSVNYTYYSPSLGSESAFSALESRYSYYHLIAERDVLAWDLYSRVTSGAVPWNMLSQLGNDKRMRGYYEGQYIDRNLLAAQVEYRKHLTGRHGMVLWVGAGAITAQAKALFTQAHWLPNAGIGYRFEFKPRVNIRLDFGVGKNTSGFYFHVNEAF